MSEKKSYSSIFGELFGLAINLGISIFVMPRLPFVTGAYSAWLPVAITTSVISSVFDLLKYFVGDRLYDPLKAISLLPEMYGVYILIIIFPFDFGRIGFGYVNPYVRFALGVSIFAMAIAFAVHLVKSFTGSNGSD